MINFSIVAQFDHLDDLNCEFNETFSLHQHQLKIKKKEYKILPQVISSYFVIMKIEKKSFINRHQYQTITKTK